MKTVAVAGLLAVAIAAPNTLSLLRRPLNRLSRSRVKSAGRTLVEKGLLTIESTGGKKFYRLTRKGRTFLGIGITHAVTPPARWDGKWRIVSFDIAQARSAQRTRLRQTLREIGFERLQDSVWVFPYDCEELITMLKTDYGLGKEVLYIIADAIENDRALRGRFGLKKK